MCVIRTNLAPESPLPPPPFLKLTKQGRLTSQEDGLNDEEEEEKLADAKYAKKPPKTVTTSYNKIEKKNLFFLAHVWICFLRVFFFFFIPPLNPRDNCKCHERCCCCGCWCCCRCCPNSSTAVSPTKEQGSVRPLPPSYLCSALPRHLNVSLSPSKVSSCLSLTLLSSLLPPSPHQMDDPTSLGLDWD